MNMTTIFSFHNGCLKVAHWDTEMADGNDAWGLKHGDCSRLCTWANPVTGAQMEHPPSPIFFHQKTLNAALVSAATSRDTTGQGLNLAFLKVDLSPSPSAIYFVFSLPFIDVASSIATHTPTKAWHSGESSGAQGKSQRCHSTDVQDRWWEPVLSPSSCRHSHQ